MGDGREYLRESDAERKRTWVLFIPVPRMEGGEKFPVMSSQLRPRVCALPLLDMLDDCLHLVM